MGASRLGIVLINGGLAVVLARIVAPAIFGQWFALQGSAALFAVIAESGLGPAAMRALAANDTFADLPPRRLFCLPACVFITGSILWFLAALLLGSSLRIVGYTVMTASLLLTQRLILDIARGTMRNSTAALVQCGADRALFLIIVVVLFLAGNTIRLGTLFVANTVGLLVILLLASSRLRRFTNASSRLTTPAFHLWRLPGQGFVWLDTTVAFTVAQGGIVLAALTIDDASVAALGLTLRVVALVSIPLQVVNMAGTPRMVAFLTRGDDSELQRLVSLWSLSSAIGAAALSLILIVSGAPLLMLAFGSEYGDAQSLLVILVVGQAFNAITGPAGTLLLALHEDRTSALITGLAALGVMISVPTLGLIYGVDGCAVGIALSLIGMNAARWRALAKKGFRSDVIFALRGRARTHHSGLRR